MAKCRASEPKIFARCAREAQKVEIGVLGVKMLQLLAARPSDRVAAVCLDMSGHVCPDMSGHCAKTALI